MSELSNRVSEIPIEQPSPERESQNSSQEESVPLLQRLALVLGFILIVVVMTTLTPQLAKKIAYSWNIGVEQAKAKIARQFLADHPVTAQRIVWVAKAVAPCVVGIHTITIRPSEEYLDARGRSVPGTLEADIGSGVIVDPQGYILTNYHVIANAHTIRVRLSDSREVEAEVIGHDHYADLAVLRIDMDDLVAVSWGDSRQVAVGERVVAVGNPYNLQQTVTAGIISATERYTPTSTMWGARRGTRKIPQEFIQTDAAINPGNSGGALVDLNGKLIGICTAIMSEHGGNTGIGFAIPSFLAKHIYEKIVSHGEVKHGWIGVKLDEVKLFDVQQMNQKKPAGAVVRSLLDNSPAREAGIQKGDIILRWDNTEITDPLHISHLVLLSEPGTKKTVEVFRKGEFVKLEVVVGVRPTDL